MLTDYHSEPLAVWAFRTRVWDYLIKPLKPEEVIRRVTELFKLLSAGHSRETRIPQSSVHPLPLEVRWSQGNGSDRAILPVVSYVEVHYPEKITLEEMARLCGLGPFQFSRLFKRLKGVTFQEFLLQHRIGKALMLLRNPRASVTDIAFAVGFNDLSHFARMFRRYVGLCPSKYRRGNGNGSP
jgi:AraC-like DNA-binding protein